MSINGRWPKSKLLVLALTSSYKNASCNKLRLTLGIHKRGIAVRYTPIIRFARPFQ